MTTEEQINLPPMVPPEEPYWWCPTQRYFPTHESKGLRLFAHLTPEYELSILLEMDAPPGVISLMYPIETFARIAEFRRALAHPLTTELANGWDGHYFFVFTAGKADRVYWRGHGHGITICVSATQWQQIRELFEAAFQHPEYARAWTRLAAQHGRG